MELLAAAGLIALQHYAFRSLGLRDRLLSYGASRAEVLSSAEWLLFAILLLNIPCIWLAADAFRRLAGDRGTRSVCAMLEEHPRLVAFAASVMAMLASILTTLCVFDNAVFTDDELTYLFQARALLDGGFTAHLPTPSSAFPHHFLLATDSGAYGGLFPVGQPALLALGLRVGTPHLTQWIAVAVTVWTMSRFAARQWNVRTSLLVAMLLATSPMLVLASATLHNIIPTTMCVAIVLYSTCATEQTGARRWGVAIGAACGLAVMCRPLDGALLSAYALVRVAMMAHPPSRRLWTLGIATLVGIPFAVFLLASYAAITGSHLTSPYEVWIARDWPRAQMFGFGPAAFGYDHSLGVAVEKTGALLVRMMTWLFGWPLSLVPLWLWIRGRGRDRATVFLVALLGAHGAAYFACTLASVHDIGSYYHVYAVPLLAVISARALLDSETRTRRPLVRVAAIASLVGTMTVWPMQLERLSVVADRVHTPMRAVLAAADDHPVIVFHAWLHSSRALGSWVFFAPIPTPQADEQVLWARTGSPALIRELVRRYPERTPLVLDWKDGVPIVTALPERFR